MEGIKWLEAPPKGKVVQNMKFEENR